MLSAFTARPLIELKQRDKSKIESALAYGDRLLVGLSTGSLRIYRVHETINEPSHQNGDAAGDERPSSQSEQKPAELMREVEKFSKYKIEQLAIVKEANILISLSNSQVSFYDLKTYDFQETLAKAKGATTFAITSNILQDEATGVPSIVSKLAVAVKRRLILWSWHESELEPETTEISLATGIKSLTWATGTKLIAGLVSSYVLVDVETNAVTDIVGPGSIGGAPGQDGGRFGGAGVASMSYLGMSAPQPLATQLKKGELLLARDINTLFIDTNGTSLGRRQIPWAFAPEAVGYSYPYLLALQSAKGTMEVRNPETLTLLQKIELPSAHQLHVPQPNVSLAHAGKGFLVLSDRCIWRMKALDYDSQIDTLVQIGRLDEALSLLGMLEDALLKDKSSRIRDIKMMKAQDLFDLRKYRESIDLFTEVAAPPQRVISLFPPFIAGNASAVPIKDSEPDEPSSVQEAGNTIENEAKSSKLPTKKPSKESGTVDPDTTSKPGPERKLLEGKDLKVATEELRGFLVSARTKMKKLLDFDGHLKSDALDTVPQNEIGSLVAKQSFDASADQERLLETAKLVDTTLFRAYMLVSPSFAGPLFRIDNFCDPDVVNEKLIEAGRHNDLVDFFYGKKLHKQALDLLKRFGESDEGNEAAPQLAGPQRTVVYLQSLPPEMVDLILQFAEWPLRKNSELGMEIFLADSENAESLPRLKILEFLRAIDENLAVRYLEHIIQELNDTTPDFHQRLVNIYIEHLKTSPDTQLTKAQPQQSKSDDPTTWKQKTLSFLQTSKTYSPYNTLSLLPKDSPPFYEARAIVLSKMGQHKQALDIYVFQLQDPDKAEEYCNQIYLAETSSPTTLTKHSRSAKSSTTADPSNTPTIYHTLLSLYLTPPPPHKPQYPPALSLLAKHGPRMPASSTLDLIPPTLPIQELESYFRGRIRSANTVVNEGKIVAGLRSSVNFKEEVGLKLGARGRRVVVSEEMVCGVCFKRFGGSAVKVLVDNSVVHYGCSTA